MLGVFCFCDFSCVSDLFLRLYILRICGGVLLCLGFEPMIGALVPWKPAAVLGLRSERNSCWPPYDW